MLDFIIQFSRDLFILACLRLVLRFIITYHILPRLTFRWPQRFSLPKDCTFFAAPLVQKRQVTLLRRNTARLKKGMLLQATNIKNKLLKCTELCAIKSHNHNLKINATPNFKLTKRVFCVSFPRSWRKRVAFRGRLSRKNVRLTAKMRYLFQETFCREKQITKVLQLVKKMRRSALDPSPYLNFFQQLSKKY